MAPPTQEEIELLLGILGPEPTATIMHGMHVDIAGKGWADFQQKIGARLAQDLYSGNPWEEGRLSRNITNLAQALAYRGKRVSILTTNYDTFLEDRWKEDREILTRQAPRLIIRTLDTHGNYPALGSQPSEEQLDSKGSVELTYLHGRVSQSASLDNSALVISEYDYAKYSHSIEKFLYDRLTNDEALLVVGSSLTDTPLINSLARTASTDAVSKRICLMPIESYDFSDRYDIDHRRYISFLEARAQALGISLYVSDFKFQIAQLVDEATLSLVAEEKGGDYLSIRYGIRLTSWWVQWSQSKLAHDHEKLQKELSDLLEVILDLVDEQGERHDSDEHFKLELWVRKSPVSERELVLWATSQAILTDRCFLNSQEIERASKISSVLALTEGRAIHNDISEIREEPPGGIVRRWNSYLSAPVYIRSEHNSRLPVGVLTIASSSFSNKSILPPKNEKKAELMLHVMMDSARDWLSLPENPSAE